MPRVALSNQASTPFAQRVRKLNIDNSLIWQYNKCYMLFGMNKKIVISVLLVVVLFVGGLLGFVIIPNSVNKFKAATGNPTTHDSVSGNGGNAVMVGEYLYFVNGFKSNSTGSLNYKDNEYNKVKGEGAIYRVKMENGRPEYDNSYLDYLDDWDEFGEYDRLDPRQKIAYA